MYFIFLFMKKELPQKIQPPSPVKKNPPTLPDQY